MDSENASLVDNTREKKLDYNTKIFADKGVDYVSNNCFFLQMPLINIFIIIMVWLLCLVEENAFTNEESTEFANEYRAREIIEKYCSFMPTEIFLSVEGAEQEFETIPEDQVKDDDVIVEHIHEDAKTEEKRKRRRYKRKL